MQKENSLLNEEKYMNGNPIENLKKNQKENEFNSKEEKENEKLKAIYDQENHVQRDKNLYVQY